MVSAGGVLAAALVFLVEDLALAGASALALTDLAEAVEADLLAEADVFVTGSSFPKCVIQRQRSWVGNAWPSTAS